MDDSLARHSFVVNLTRSLGHWTWIEPDSSGFHQMVKSESTSRFKGPETETRGKLSSAKDREQKTEKVKV